MATRVAVVTDSTAYLPAVEVARHGVTVVPLTVLIDGVPGADGIDVTAADVADALRNRRRVSTSRPAPDRFAETYARAAEDGTDAVVSVHLSARMSSTLDSARLAAKSAPVPVEVVDSQRIGMGLGFGVLAAAEAAAAGADAAVCAEVAAQRSTSTDVYFYVDTLEYLHRGGRMGMATSLMGNALMVKPLLRVHDGQISLLEKVRTRAKAMTRLEEIAVASASGAPGTVVDLAVQHLAGAERAGQLAERLRDCLPRHRRLFTGEVGGVVGAHVGPGMIAVTVSRHRPHASG
ncbi:MAG: DegV family EDD domain-containing protein [Streptosporangiales bacterium]|nr:DegV family EDD domain-containing protein [Streptosporangiales bacterium]